MTIKTSAFIGISLDGFLARPDGGLDWLNAADQQGVDHGYNEFIANVDVVLMGRKTFEIVLPFPDWPYGSHKVIVLSSSSPQIIPPRLSDKASVMQGSISSILRELDQSGFQHVYVDGGTVIQQFIWEDLLDEITITTLPVLIGSGIPLFGSLKRDVHLELIRTSKFVDGMTQSVYRFIHSPR